MIWPAARRAPANRSSCTTTSAQDNGALIAISEGGEAAQPFYPAQKPVDAYNAALLDDVQLH